MQSFVLSERTSPPGAHVYPEGVDFCVWAPFASHVDLVIEDRDEAIPMDASEDFYFRVSVPGIGHGTLYRYRVDGAQLFPDPASRFQPEGVHGPSMVVDPSLFEWSDREWKGVRQEDLVFYELHVGTFTPVGTYEGIRSRLGYLRELGITAIELMPLADFPGRWGWGYDHAALYAPCRAYGDPDDLRALVNDAHRASLAVYLDVIYNHLGPDGAYAAAFAPFFTDKHRTPWGQAINLDDVHSEGVRRFFIENALYWLREFHFDGLRLDATHALKDDSPTHFLAELSATVGALQEGPRRLLIAEDHRNLNKMIRSRHVGGYGLDGLWIDDFHHQARNLTAGDEDGYYASYARTTTSDLADTIERGWFFDGRMDPAQGVPRGTDPTGVKKEQCVFCIQNHDQIGNRPTGNRLSEDLSLPLYRAVSALLLWVPEIPLLFMGQEWAATSPFQFFTDHNEELGRLVSAGRREEFKNFAGFQETIPDPQDPGTFYRSKLRWEESDEFPHRGILNLYRDVLAFRKQLPFDVQVKPHDRRSIQLTRGDYHLLVNLAENNELVLPENAKVWWHTDMADYTADAEAPTWNADIVRFTAPGAVIVTTGGRENLTGAPR